MEQVLLLIRTKSGRGDICPCPHGSDGPDLIAGDERAAALFDVDLLRL